LLRFDLLGRGGDLGPRRERGHQKGLEHSVLAGLGWKCLVVDVVIDGAFHSHGLVHQQLGPLVRVVRVDDLHFRIGEVCPGLGQVDRRARSRLHESLDLDQMIALVGQGLSRDGEQLFRGDCVEEGNADLQGHLLHGGALLIGGRARAGLRRAPAVAGLPEVPEELRQGHGAVGETDGAPGRS